MIRHPLFAVLRKIHDERTRQDAIWGAQHQPALLWMNILGEEAGEAAEAIIAYKATASQEAAEHLYTELIQTAAVAIAYIEHVDHACPQLAIPHLRPHPATSTLAALDDLRVRAFDIALAQPADWFYHELGLAARTGKLVKANLQIHEGRRDIIPSTLRQLALDVATNALITMDHLLPASLSHAAA